MELKQLKDITNLKGKRVLARLELNVPIREGKVVNDFRLRTMLETLRHLSGSGARTIIIAHIDEKNVDDGEETLLPVYEYLKDEFSISFVRDFLGKEGKQAVDGLADGETVLFENLRMHSGEKSNDEPFAQTLASYAEFYVNDAFSVCHREHASIIGIPCFLPGVIGFQFAREIENLSRALKPASPSLLIIGGNKFETKLPLARKFLGIVDRVFVAGLLARAFCKAELDGADSFGVHDIAHDKHLVLPEDVSGEGWTKPLGDLEKNDVILDIGPKALEELINLVGDSKSIIWNGPVSDYARGYSKSNEDVALAVAQSGAYSVVGGGDTVASIASLDLWDRFSFVSTAGGAMVQFLSDETLPGIIALKKSSA